MTERSSYSGLQIGLHWLVALLVAATWYTGGGMGRALQLKLDGSDPGFRIHVWLGLAVLAAVILRVATRLATGAPGPLPEASATEATARHWGHGVLYLLLLAVPLGGAAAWFLGMAQVAELHAFAANTLVYLAGAHAAIALWHHYVRKDATLRRMTRPA